MSHGSIEIAKLKNGQLTRQLTAVCEAGIHGAWVSGAIRDCGALTTWHSKKFDQPLYKTAPHEIQLISPAKNPFLVDPDRQGLDPSGLALAGTTTRAGAALASIIMIHTSGMMSVGTAPKGFLRVSDACIRCPSEWAGAIVCSTECTSGKGTAVEITLERFHPLDVGDVVFLGQFPVTVAGWFEPGSAADVRVDPNVGRALGLTPGQSCQIIASVASDSGHSALRCRATGAYSLITRMPLGGRSRTAGQPLSASHVHTLRSVGLYHNLTELLTLKSSDAGSRPAVRAAAEGRAPFPTPGAPFGLHVLATELTALGLRPRFTADGDHLTTALCPMTDQDRRALSSGQVTKPETITYRTYAPTPGGLFCETIFGPERESGYHLRFGHIELPSPVVPFIWHMRGPSSAPSFLASLLDITDHQLTNLLHHNLWLTILDHQPTFHDSPGEADGALTAVDAVAALLQLTHHAHPHRPDLSDFILARTILLPPPDLRPLILLESGNFATSDLNDHYRRIINRANRLRKLVELNAPPVIIANERRMLQAHADSLFANEFTPRPVLGSNNRPLSSILNMILNTLQKDDAVRTDYSARARAVPAIDSDTFAVPDTIMATLQLTPAEPVLLTRPGVADESGTPFIILRVAGHAHAVVALPSQAYNHLFAGLSGPHECILHRPLAPKAREEAGARVGLPLMAAGPWHEDAWFSWVPNDLVANLLAAALGPVPLQLASPRSLLIAGPGITTLTPIEPDPLNTPTRFVDIPAPSEA